MAEEGNRSWDRGVRGSEPALVVRVGLAREELRSEGWVGTMLACEPEKRHCQRHVYCPCWLQLPPSREWEGHITHTAAWAGLVSSLYKIEALAVSAASQVSAQSHTRLSPEPVFFR